SRGATRSCIASGQVIGASERIARGRVVVGLRSSSVRRTGDARLHIEMAGRMPALRFWQNLCYCYRAFALVGAETEQGGYVPHLVKRRLVFYVEQFDVTKYGVADNGIADILEFTGCVSTGRTMTDEMRVEVSATGALHGPRLEVVPNQQRLYFAQFQRAQDPAQSG